MDHHIDDVVIIGAGIFGIAAAAFYLETHPKARLKILDRDNGIGGVWNTRRHYATFWSQIGFGMCEFSDLPMKRPPVLKNGFFDASHVTQYMEEYMAWHRPDGISLKDRLILNFSVESVAKLASVWHVTGAFRARHERTTFPARKIIVATGLTSEPNIPDFPGRADFLGNVIHQREFGESGVLKDEHIKHVCVVGGAKSAADMVYASVKAGKTVSWLIRKSGSGPAAFIQGAGKGLYENSPELGATRLMALMSPSIYSSTGLWTWILHRTSLGLHFINGFWNIATKVSREVFTSGIQARECFQKLKPSVDIFWSNDTVGLIQFDDFWPTIAQNVSVHRGDISHLSAASVHTDTGEVIKADAILCGTGWVRRFPFFTREQAEELGLPFPLSESTKNDTPWSELEAEADHQVLSRFPKLRHPPDSYREKQTTSTPFRLYNLIAPLNELHEAEHSIVFLGCAATPNAFRPAEAQAIWATAYLDGHANAPTVVEEAHKQIALMVAWNRRRYLNNGRLGNHLHYDMVAYTDRLMQDLGLTAHIDNKSWWRYWTEPCFARDLKEVRREYMTKFGGAM